MPPSNDSDNYEIFFVRCTDNDSECAKRMQLAFESMTSHELNPEWITEAECFQVKEKEHKLFVLDPFEGKLFDHLHHHQCRIIGPLCILSCLQLNENLPKRQHPVYSVAMRGITVTCSNLDKNTREAIWEKVQFMSGICSKDLKQSVTHLVVGEVGSKKYHVAANFRLSIMLPEWVTDLWEKGQFKQIHGSDPSYSAFRCPVFKGLSITVSQLSCMERNKYKELIESNGGRYSGSMNSKDTTHLVLLEPKGEKYKFAQSWKLYCVKTSWIDDSLKSGYCMDENLYKFDSSEMSPPFRKSTPIKDKAEENPIVDCSAINVTLASHLDETTRSEYSIFLKPPTVPSLGLLDAFDVSTLPKFGQILDGCKIYLSGFKGAHLEKLRKIVNAGGGIRFSNFSESLSHVICGEKNSELFQLIKNCSVKPNVVTFDWLLECCKKQKLVDEGPFICSDAICLSPAKEPVEETNKASSKSATTSFTKDLALAEDFSEILKQYAGENKEDKAALQVANCSLLQDTRKTDATNMSLPVNQLEQVKCDYSKGISPKIEAEEHVPGVNNSLKENFEEGLFSGKIFTFLGFAPQEIEVLTNTIKLHHGTVSDLSRCEEIDIAIVPLIWNNFNIKASVIATTCWLQKCVEENRIFKFDENELFKPFNIKSNIQPLKNMVISISQYSGTERDCLMHLAEVLGASCQEYFVRKANSSKNLLPNTHLIAASPEGSKYEASKKWQIPAVTKYWLLEAAKTNVAPPVGKFLVGLEIPKESTFFSDIVCLSKNNIAESKVITRSTAAKHANTICVENELVEGASIQSPTINVQNNRVKKLIDNDKAFSPKANISNDLNTPDRFNDKSFKAQFNVSGILRALDTTSGSDCSDMEARHRKLSIPLNDAISRNLVCTLDFVSNPSEACPSPHPIARAANLNKKIFDGIILCVSRKLGSIQLDVNKIVLLLGGEFRWTFDNSCTHYVFQGKANDLNKEFREARRLGKKIVSPDWVYDCKEANIRLSESLYPHTFKSKLSLSDISTSSATTNKSVKSSDQNVCENVIENPDENVNTFDVSKQLDEIIVAAKSAKKRRGRRTINSSTDNSLSRDDKNGMKTPSSSPAIANVYLNANVEHEAALSEPSQSFPIIWDDPMGRMEREKIAANDVINGKAFSPKSNGSENITKKNAELKNEKDEDKRIVVNDDEPTVNHCDPIRRKFMFTSLTDEEKQDFTTVIIRLGGQVSEFKSFDETATHLIVGHAIRNEKFLASVASGKWVLHKSYIDDSASNNAFLAEELYELGSSMHVDYSLNKSALEMSRCPHRWRIKISKDNCKAFDGWKVVVFADASTRVSYERILQAGGAEVLPRNTSASQVTHVFVNTAKNLSHFSELESLVSQGIKCIKPEYLAFYLIHEPPPSVQDYLIPDLSALKCDSESKKRPQASLSKERKKAKLKN